MSKPNIDIPIPTEENPIIAPKLPADEINYIQVTHPLSNEQRAQTWLHMLMCRGYEVATKITDDGVEVWRKILEDEIVEDPTKEAPTKDGKSKHPKVGNKSSGTQTNLLAETRKEFKNLKLLTKNIEFIGNLEKTHRCTWNQFKRLANFDYDSGFGDVNVAIGLVILFKDGSLLTRNNYDGNEGWKLVKPFILGRKKKFKTISAEWLRSGDGI